MPNQWRRMLLLRPWQRHSLVLLVGGIVYLIIGVTMINAASDLPVRAQEALKLALHMAPLNVWGFIFTISGILAILSSRWPTFSLTWGYTVLTGLSVAWGATYVLGGIVLHAPVSNIVSGLVWCLMGFLWWGISGLMNPPLKAEPNDEPN